MTTNLTNNVLGTVEAYSVHQVERGDNVTFKLHPDILPGAAVAAQDTVCNLNSSELVRQLARLRGERAAQMSLLLAYQAGEKASVVEEAKKRILQERRG